MEAFEVVKEMGFMLNTFKMNQERNKPEPVSFGGVIWHYPCISCNQIDPQNCSCPLPIVTQPLQEIL